MTATATSTTATTLPEAYRRPVLWRVGVITGLAAAAATTAVAAVARAADVPLRIAGKPIPLAGFAELTLVATLLGVLIAKAAARWASSPRRAFTLATVALTAGSFVPDATADTSTASRLVLMLTHVVAAAIVIPTLARRITR